MIETPAGCRAEEEEGTGGYRPRVVVVLAALTVAAARLQVLLCPPSPGARGEAALQWTAPRRAPRIPAPLHETARRELRHRTGSAGAHLEQLHTAEAGGGVPALEVGYLCLLPPAPAERCGGGAQWWPAAALPPLSAGDIRLVEQARSRLRRKLAHTRIAASLLPAEFPLSELQAVYEAVEGRELDKRNFRKWALTSGLVEPTARLRRDGAHRPARLHRFPGDEPAAFD